jgi:hypothetical protein
VLQTAPVENFLLICCLFLNAQSFFAFKVLEFVFACVVVLFEERSRRAEGGVAR